MAAKMPPLPSEVQQTYDALGYDAKKVFEAFVELQRAFDKNDFDAFVRLASLPLRINRPGERLVIKNRAEIRRHRALIFSPHNAQVVKEQKFEALSLRDEGAMVGDGELWISGACTDTEKKPCHYGVTAVNAQ
jgi:hypothetical protein